MKKVIEDRLLQRVWLWELREKVLEDGKHTWVYAHKVYGWVAVLPVDSYDRIALIKIFRVPLEKEVWEIIRGSGEPDLTEEQVAWKEVEEELWIKPKKVWYLGKVAPESAFLDSEVPIFVAEFDDFAKYKIWGKDTRNYEGIVARQYFEFEQIKKMIKNEEIEDGFTFAALCKWSVKK